MTVKTYHSLPEAEVGRSILEQNGIPAHLPDRNVVAAAWHLTQAVGGIRLQVPESELAPARLLLGEQDGALDGGGLDTCPECGSGDIFRPASLLLGVAVCALTGIPLLWRRRARYCRRCQQSWRATPS